MGWGVRIELRTPCLYSMSQMNNMLAKAVQVIFSPHPPPPPTPLLRRGLFFLLRFGCRMLAP